MKGFKKLTSVAMAFVMLVTVFSIGFTGILATAEDSSLYSRLARALENEYVRDLTNYTITNDTVENGAEGFDSDANGFARNHCVTANDNSEGDILRAANAFYCIAENLISTKYGVGCYNPKILIKTVGDHLKQNYFSDDSGELTYYMDFYGEAYEPTPEEIEAYENAVFVITASDKEVTQASLSAFNIYFWEKNKYDFYNIDTILQYFCGNASEINAGNYYHRYTFVCETSINTVLLEQGNILQGTSGNSLVVRKAVYEMNFKKEYDDKKSQSHYTFVAPSLRTTWEDNAYEFSGEGYDASLGSVDLTPKVNGNNNIATGGQSAAFLIKEKTDTETIPVMRAIAAVYTPYISKAPVYDGDTVKSTWDAGFASWTDDTVRAQNFSISYNPDTGAYESATADYRIIGSYLDYLTETYTNDVLLSVYGDAIGNMITYSYIMKPSDEMPSRTVRGEATYDLDAGKLNRIVREMDALVYDEDNDVAQRVGTIVKQFFNTNSSLFEGTAVEGMDFTDLHELVKHLVVGLLFTDKIVNTLVGLVYPLIVDLLEEKVYDAITREVGSGISGLAENLIDNIIAKNELAIHPDTLANRIASDYPNKFNDAVAVLRAAGGSWENVNFDALHWGVDDASYEDKSAMFTDALCAGLGGFMRLLVTVFCGDAEYTENAGLSYDNDQYNVYYDKHLLSIGSLKGLLRSQGAYTKLIVPLFKILGLEEQEHYTGTCYGYLSSREYNRLISTTTNGNYNYFYSLRMIVEPIVFWVTDILAEKPFETLWSVLPNLVYFFTREGYGPTSLDTLRSNWKDDEVVDRTHGGISNGVPGYEQLQTYNIFDILDSIFINISIDGWIVKKNIDVGSLASLIDKDEMFASVNGLLNEILDFEYSTGIIDEVMAVAYKSNGGEIVLYNSVEYVTNPGNYPIEINEVWSNNTETVFSETETEECYIKHENVKYVMKPYRIPALQESKLTSTSTLVPGTTDTLASPNAIGYLREDNTICVTNPGVVLLYVLRFVFSALGYKYDISEPEDEYSKHVPYLIECFGLDIDRELFQGFSLSEIIYNVMLHPDETICSLLELFYPNETGDYYENKAYTYPISPINYHNSTLLNKSINPGLTYGTEVEYSKYWTREYAADTVTNAGTLVENVLSMLQVEGFENGVGGYLENLLNENVFNDDLLNTLFNTVYQLLAGLNDSVGFDLEAILDAALDVSFTTSDIATSLRKTMGYATGAYSAINEAMTWQELFTVSTEINPETNEEIIHTGDVSLDWGIDSAEEHGITRADAFLRAASAILSPAAFVFRFLFMDMDLNLLGLITLPGYAGYQYSLIGLFEALSCPGILTYNEYYEKGQDPENGDANTIYYALKPILNLLDKVYEDPINTLLSLVPNLLFFVSIGGLNDLVNNLVHFAYVLLDILKPIVNGYDLLSGLLSNINISGYILNLTLPLDIDFNALASDLISVLVGNSLEISGVAISLPYIDFHTLCCGSLRSFASKEERATVYLDSASGGDLLTAVLRLALQIVYMDENRKAIREILVNAVDKETIDDFDKQTIDETIDLLFGLIQEYQIPDMLLFAVYFLVSKLTPVSDSLAPKLASSGVSLTQLFGAIENPELFISYVSAIATGTPIGGSDSGESGDSGSSDPGHGSQDDGGQKALTLFDRIKLLFQKIAEFFRNLFTF